MRMRWVTIVLLILFIGTILLIGACAPKKVAEFETKSVAGDEPLTTEEIQAQIAKDPTVGLDKGDAQKGKDYFYSENRGRCLACHTLGGEGEKGSYPLDDAGLRRDPVWLAIFLSNPRTQRPEVARMPPFRGDKIATIADTVAFLMTLKTVVDHPAPTDVKPANEPDRNENGVGGRKGQNKAFDD
jgi:mono/diheme cytochrome c family protein